MNQNMYSIFRALLLEEESLRYRAGSTEEGDLHQSERSYLRYCADIVQKAVSSLSGHWPLEAWRAERAGGDKAEDASVSSSALDESRELDTYPALLLPEKQPEDPWATNKAKQILARADAATRRISQGRAVAYTLHFFRFLDHEVLKFEKEEQSMPFDIKRQVKDYLNDVRIKSY